MAENEKKGKEVTPAPSSRAISPFEEMERMFDSFFPRGWLRPWHWEWPSTSHVGPPFVGKVPSVDIVDRDNEVVIHAELPGVKKEDLDISVTDNAVTIKGSSHQQFKEEKGDYYRREISKGSFSRTVALPCEVDGDQAKASFKDGILELVLPKVARSKRRSVKVE